MKETSQAWNPPQVNINDITPGDMPGDKVQIGDSHIKRAETIFPKLLELIQDKNGSRAVVAVHGGSGVGKSEIGSLIAHYLKLMDIPSYVLSGDNYPRRIPQQNDAERLNVYRYAGITALAKQENFSNQWMSELHRLWETLEDCDSKKAGEGGFEWLKIYQQAGRAALEGYLGTSNEIDFSILNSIIKNFKDGAEKLVLKRMGRTPGEIGFEEVDFSGTKVLVIEWTHGNNAALEGTDIPIYLFSTPEETLAHRRSRARDKGVDSHFTKLVLEIEQNLLNDRAKTAKLIVSKNAEILSYDIFQERLKG